MGAELAGGRNIQAGANRHPKEPCTRAGPGVRRRARACTMGTLPCSRQSTLSSTQCVTQYARSRISMTSGKVGGATRSSTVFCVPRARASSSPAPPRGGAAVSLPFAVLESGPGCCSELSPRATWSARRTTISGEAARASAELRACLHRGRLAQQLPDSRPNPSYCSVLGGLLRAQRRAAAQAGAPAAA